MNKLLLTSMIAAGAGLTACSGDDGKNGESGQDGANSLIQQTTIASGDAQCLLGGVRVDSGLDSNVNGTLDESEISETNYLCSNDAFQLQLLHFADVDGGRDILSNAVRFSALLDHFKSEYTNTVVLSAGDNWIPGPEYNVASDSSLEPVLGVADTGRAHVAYLNALGVQASVFGNHEFDLGTGAIAGLLSAEVGESGTWPGARFPYLSANLDFSTDSQLAPLVAENGLANTSLNNKIAASTVITVNGHRIGVVGATTPTLNTISSPGDVSIAPADSTNIVELADEIQSRVDSLTEAGINKIILLSHMQQIAVERELAMLLNDVDIIVAGGSNTLLADSNDRLRDGDTAADVYPLVFDSARSEPTLVVNTDGDYTYLGRLVVTFDGQGVLVPSLLDESVNGAYATDETGLIENGLGMDDALPEVVEITEALTEALAARAGNVFGSTSVYLNGERGSVRTQETNFGSLTAQANLEYAQETDSTVAISIKNGGGIRAPIGFCNVPAGATGEDALECNPPAGIEGINRAGEISQLDLEIALRFNNALTLLTLTGAELKEILEHGVAASGEGATPGQFPQVGGVRFSFDPAQTAQTVDTSVTPPSVATAGARVRNLVVLDSNGAEAGGSEVVVVRDGVLEPTAAAQTFRIVTLGFLAGGGDSYPFPSGAAANVVELEQEGVQTGNTTFADNGTEQDALAEYLFVNYPADESDATASYSVEDVDAVQDTTIQNLEMVAEDTVIGDD